MEVDRRKKVERTDEAPFYSYFTRQPPTTEGSRPRRLDRLAAVGVSFNIKYISLLSFTPPSINL